MEDEVFVSEVRSDLLGIGDSITISGVLVKVNSISEQEYNLSDIKKSILISVSIENTELESLILSSRLKFRLYDTDYNVKDSNQIIAINESSAILLPGEIQNIDIVYEVSVLEHEWDFVIQPELYNYGQGFYRLSTSNIK